METTVTLKASALEAAIIPALACVGDERTSGRRALEGVHVKTLEHGLLVEGADGFRLATTTITTVAQVSSHIDVILAASSKSIDDRPVSNLKDMLPLLRKAAKNDDSVTLTTTKHDTSIILGATRFTFGHIDGTFPNCAQLIPQPTETGHRLAFNPALVGDVLKALDKVNTSSMVRFYPPSKDSRSPMRITSRNDIQASEWRTQCVIMPMFTDDWD